MKGKIITLMCASALLSSCHIYKTYDRPEDITTEGLYRDTAAVDGILPSDTTNFGNLPWREVFTDPQLQGYIEQALTSRCKKPRPRCWPPSWPLYPPSPSRHREP